MHIDLVGPVRNVSLAVQSGRDGLGVAMWRGIRTLQAG